MMVMRFVERLLGTPFLLDAPDDGGAGGAAPPEGGTPAADNNGATKPGEGAGTQKPVVVTPPAGKLEDDPRYKGMFADLQKERKARQQYDTDLKAAKADLDRERKRVLALSGVEPKSQADTDAELVRQRLGQINPALTDLTAEDIKAWREMQAEMKGLQEARNHQWQVHGQKMLASATSGIQKALGGKLSERQEVRIRNAYVAEAEASPQFLARHEMGDPTLVDEFVKGWLEDFVEPGKRQGLAQEVARRPRVPGGKDRSIVGAGEKAIDVKDDKAVEDMLVKSFREKGGQFGRR